MKNNLRLLVLFFCVVFIATSCHKPVPDLALLIPKDAASVFEVDPKALTDKLSASGIGIDSLANMFFTSKNQYALHWNDVKNSGIDLAKPVFTFNGESGSIQNGNTKSMCVIASINDKNKLVSFLKKQKPGGDFLSGGKYQYVALGNDFVAGWTDKVLIISSVTGGNSAPGTYNSGEGTLSQQQLTTLFSLNEAQSIASIGEFRDMLSKNGDIHFWSNPASQLNAVPMLGMTKLATLFEDTYTEGTIDFDNGKAVAETETHYNKTFADLLEKYPSRQIDKSMIANYPKPVNGFSIVAFNPKILFDIIHYLGFDTMADGYISQMGFTLNDVMNAFSGDIAFMMSDIFVKDDVPGVSNMNTKNGAFILNMRIGNKDAFNKMLTGLVNKNILTKNGDEYQFGNFGGHSFTIEITNDNLLIGSSDELIKSYEAANNKNVIPADVEKEINNKSMALYVDVNSILKNISTNDTTGKTVLQQAQSTFKNVIGTYDEPGGKTIKGNFELNFINNNENSLASIVKFFGILQQENIRNKISPPVFMNQIPRNDTDSSADDSD